jgi:hypothetical protein
MIKKILIFSTGVCVGLVPYFHGIETVKRGYEAFGGEFFLPILPFLLYIFGSIIKSEIKDIFQSKGGYCR